MMAFSWFTGNPLEASSDRPFALIDHSPARGLSDVASRITYAIIVYIYVALALAV